MGCPLKNRSFGQRQSVRCNRTDPSGRSRSRGHPSTVDAARATIAHGDNHSAFGEAEWEQWAHRMSRIMTDQFGLVRTDAKVQAVLEEVLISELRSGALVRKLEILRTMHALTPRIGRPRECRSHTVETAEVRWDPSVQHTSGRSSASATLASAHPSPSDLREGHVI
jgi:hypothetical protein